MIKWLFVSSFSEAADEKHAGGSGKAVKGTVRPHTLAAIVQGRGAFMEHDLIVFIL